MLEELCESSRRHEENGQVQAVFRSDLLMLLAACTAAQEEERVLRAELTMCAETLADVRKWSRNEIEREDSRTSTLKGIAHAVDRRLTAPGMPEVK